jgi:3-hydroxyisobutyrate dehydrogenase-like beta-hydroxyacid dehydrogenase
MNGGVMETVGIVGVGDMGSALLERQRLAHVEQLAYDINPQALERARANGAEPAASAADLARRVTIVDVVLRTDDEVLEGTLGEGGVLAGARPGTLVLLLSSILPQTTKRVAEEAAKREVQVIDACMLGVPNTVRAGGLTFVVGGPDDLFERARPHLLTMAKEARHMGPLGSGNVAKLIRNLTLGAETLVVWEAIRLAEEGGIPYVQALEFLRETQGDSMLHRWRNSFDETGVDPTPRVGHNVLGKDVPLAGELARVYGLDLPIIEQLAAAGLRLAAGQAH